ncbi:tripartite tricarboxylate transporter TctB family protein [bacterium]|nr:MAG: tripartite tricarboxylate transporter TctB family protein [bacterium]
MKKTYVINDLVWITLALLVCAGGLHIGFGSFHEPHAGFMPFLAGLLLGVLALIDLASAWMGRCKELREDRQIWSGIHWGKILLTMSILFAYTFLAPILGFVIGTFLLMLILFRIMERRPWWMILLASLGTTGLFYLVFQIGLEGQLPRGFFGF